MGRIALGLVVLAALLWLPGCGDGSSSTTDDGAAPQDDGGGDVRPDVPTDVPHDAPADTPTDGPGDLPADGPSDTPTDTPTDTPADACDGVDPSARLNGAYAVTSLEVVRPDVFGTVLPSLAERITLDDIYVVLASPDLAVASTTFALEVGQAIEYLYPPRSRFCTDALCGYPPNTVSTFAATVDACNAFATTEPTDLVFSLYPPPHPGSAKPLTIRGATIAGTLDPRRDTILDGVVTGGLTGSDADSVYPMTGINLRGLLTAAGVALDYDDDGDTALDGWQVELHFRANWVEFVR